MPRELKPRAPGRTVRVAGRTIRVSHPDKPLYPDGFTKGQILDYYLRAAPFLLPHLRGRAVTLRRAPEGVEGEVFYEKHCPRFRPDWLGVVPVPGGRRGVADYCRVDDAAALAWLVNLDVLEFHPSLFLAADQETPTHLVLDLDPGPPADVLTCAEVALILRDALADRGLAGFVKTSGSKGLHLAVPLNSPVGFDRTKSFAKGLADRLERDRPELVTASMDKERRPGRVFLDWSQNSAAKTTACVHSLRARRRPTVSTPLSWEELTEALAAKDASSLSFETEQALKRMERLGDLFAPLPTLRQSLPTS